MALLAGNILDVVTNELTAEKLEKSSKFIRWVTKSFQTVST